MISPFDPSRESAEEYEGRVRELIERRKLGKRSESPNAYERRLRSMLIEHLPPEMRQQLRCFLKNGSYQQQSRTALLYAIDTIGKKSLVLSKKSMGAKSTNSSARNRLRHLQQRPNTSVVDFLKELEDTVAQCGYPSNVADSVASQRLVAGLRSFKARATLVDLMERPVGASYEELRSAALLLPFGGPGGDGSKAPRREMMLSIKQETPPSSVLRAQQSTGDIAPWDFFQVSGGKSGGSALQMLNGSHEEQREQQQHRKQASDMNEPSSNGADREQGIYVQLWPANGDGSNCARQVRAVPRGGSSNYVWSRQDCGTGGQSDGSLLQGIQGVQRGVGVTYPHQISPLAQAECEHCGVVSNSSFGACPLCFTMFRN